MINDSYSEDLVVGKPTFINNMLLALSVLCILIGVSMTLFVSGLGLIIIIIAVSALIFIMSRRKVEYEYIITNGDADIAVIFNKSVRKNKYAFTVEEINYIAPSNSPRFEGDIKQGKIKKTLNFASNANEDHSYGFVIEKVGEKTLVILELSDKSVDIYKSCAKNKFYKD